MDFDKIRKLLNNRNLSKELYNSTMICLEKFHLLTKNIIPPVFACHIVSYPEDGDILFISWSNTNCTKSLLLAISGEPETEEDPAIGTPILLLIIGDQGIPFSNYLANPSDNDMVLFAKQFAYPLSNRN